MAPSAPTPRREDAAGHRSAAFPVERQNENGRVKPGRSSFRSSFGSQKTARYFSSEMMPMMITMIRMICFARPSIGSIPTR